MGEINLGLLDYYAGNKFTFYQFSNPAHGDRTYSFDVILFSKTYSSFLLVEIILLVQVIVNHVSATDATYFMLSEWLFQVILNNQGR